MDHEVKILYQPLFLARPWGVVCTCGFKAAEENELEAERIKAYHERLEQQKAELRKKGLLA